MCWSERFAFNFPQIPPCELWGVPSKLPYRDGGAECQCDNFIGLRKIRKYCQVRDAEVRMLCHFLKVVWKMTFPDTFLMKKTYLSKSGMNTATFDFIVCLCYTIYCRKMKFVILALVWNVLVSSNQSISVVPWDCCSTCLWSISVRCCFNSICRCKTTLRKFSGMANHSYILSIKDSLTSRLFWV